MVNIHTWTYTYTFVYTSLRDFLKGETYSKNPKDFHEEQAKQAIYVEKMGKLDEVNA